jgi:hypothetical protein
LSVQPVKKYFGKKYSVSLLPQPSGRLVLLRIAVRSFLLPRAHQQSQIPKNYAMTRAVLGEMLFCVATALLPTIDYCDNRWKGKGDWMVNLCANSKGLTSPPLICCHTVTPWYIVDF